MRQALGLRGDQSSERPAQRREQERRTRRFVKDGEVPVVVLSPSREHGPDGGPAPVNRIAAAEAALRSERVARERAERALRETQVTLQHIQTKLAHADLAHSEALAAERRSREQAEAALAEAIVVREGLEARLAEMAAAAAPPAPEPAPEPPPKPSRSAAIKPRRKAAASTIEREPQPVKWWLPSYKAKTRAT